MKFLENGTRPQPPTSLHNAFDEYIYTIIIMYIYNYTIDCIAHNCTIHCIQHIEMSIHWDTQYIEICNTSHTIHWKYTTHCTQLCNILHTIHWDVQYVEIFVLLSCTIYYSCTIYIHCTIYIEMHNKYWEVQYIYCTVNIEMYNKLRFLYLLHNKTIHFIQNIAYDTWSSELSFWACPPCVVEKESKKKKNWDFQMKALWRCFMK